MKRVFRADGTLVHDPLTGLTHQAPSYLRSGRASLDPRTVTAWPRIAPGETGRCVPVSICWSPIVRCNLSCPMCLDDTSVRELGRAHRAQIAEVIGASGVLGVDISGGEPLLLGDLPDLARTLTKAGCVVSVTTNGWHLSRRADELAGVLDALRVSIDGPSAPLHDAWRGRGSFDRAVAGVRAAAAAGLPVQIQTVLMKSSSSSLQELVELAKDIGAAGLTVLQMLPIGAGECLADREMLTDSQAGELVDALSVPDDFGIRLRTCEEAGGFTVVRADGQVWRNRHPAQEISSIGPLREAADLALTGRDGSA